jgi:hypothetical protein
MIGVVEEGRVGGSTWEHTYPLAGKSFIQGWLLISPASFEGSLTFKHPMIFLSYLFYGSEHDMFWW